MDTFGITFFLVEKQMKLMSFKSRSSSNLSMLILIWNHSRSPTWSKFSPPDVNQLLMRRRPILNNFTTGEERALLRFCCLMWRQRRNRNRTDQQTGMCSPLMRFDLKGKKERALLKCLIALLWIGNIFYNERYSSDLCRSKYTLKLCFVSLNNFSIMKETLVIIIVVIKLPKIHGGSQRELFNQKIVMIKITMKKMKVFD